MTSPTPQNPDADQFQPLLHTLRDTTYKVLLFRGIIGIVIGLLLLIVPAITAATLGIFFAISLATWLIFDGAGSISVSLKRKKLDAPQWGWLMTAGIITILVGIAIIIFPLSFAAAGSLLVLWMLAIGVIISGVVQIADRHSGNSNTILGVINLIFGIIMVILLFANPAATLVAMIWIAGVYSVVFGILSIILAFQIRPAKQS